MAYITSNSWLKAKYGKALRRYFSERHTPLRLLEMGKDVFKNAIVDTNILILRTGKCNETGKAVDMDRLADEDFPPPEDLWGTFRPRVEKPWSSLSASEQPILDKMEATGIQLIEWDVEINRGTVTGYNKAFIIDDATRQALIGAHPNSAEIIRPVLRGRDIQRYQARWANLWLVYIRKGTEIKRYPAIYGHLQRYMVGLSEKAGANKWYELQARCLIPIDMFRSPSEMLDARFRQEKLVWMDLTDQG